MLRRLRPLAVGVVAAGLVLASAPSATADVPVSQAGWWTRSPSPPTVPEGGIAVAAAPDGDLTVGAIAIEAGDGASGVGLRLVETGGQGQAIAALVACPTTTAWSAEAGGAMADAPPADQCESAGAPLTRAEDGTWTAELPFAEGASGLVGILVKPASGAVAFQLSFAPPDVTGSVATSSGSSGSFASDSTASEPATSSSPSGSTSGSPSFVAPSAPAAPDVQSGATTVTTVAIEEVDVSAGSSDVAAPTFGSVPSGGGAGSRVTKMTVVLWYVVALLIGTVAAGIAWARNEGHLTPTALVELVRRRA